MLKFKVTKKRTIGFYNLKIKAKALKKLSEYAKRKKVVGKLGDAIKLNHRRLVLSFCIGIMVEKY